MGRYSREDSNLRPPTKVSNINASEGVFVHYTAGRHSDEVERSKETVRRVQADHMDNRGWRDIGYSWMVDDAGNIFEARGWGVEGAHTKGYNDKTHAVCYLGKDGEPTNAAKQAIKTLVEEHHAKYGEGYVKCHKDAAATSCPGDHLTKWVNDGLPLTEISGGDIA